jgi:hypothetical protein
MNFLVATASLKMISYLCHCISTADAMNSKYYNFTAPFQPDRDPGIVATNTYIYRKRKETFFLVPSPDLSFGVQLAA